MTPIMEDVMEAEITWGVMRIEGRLFGCPYTKDQSILGSILSSLVYGSYEHVIETFAMM